MVPSAFVDGQSVCAGCGLDAISCERESLLTKVTLWPTLIVTCAGLTAPLLPMVMVAPLAPGLLLPPPPDGDVGELLPPHAAITIAAPAATMNAETVRVLTNTTSSRSRASEELPRDVESDEPVVVREAAVGNLPQRRSEPVRDIQLEQVPARAPLQAEAHLTHTRLEPREPRRDFSDQVGCRTDAEPCRQIPPSACCCRNPGRPQGCCSRHKTAPRTAPPSARRCARPRCRAHSCSASRRLFAALERRDRIEPQRLAIPLRPEVVLAEQLDRPVARAMDPDLRAAGEAIPQLESDLRPRIEAEEVRREIAEVSLAERPREPVRDAERQLVHRHPQRRRQRRKVEIGLERVDPCVGIGFGGVGWLA